MATNLSGLIAVCMLSCSPAHAQVRCEGLGDVRSIWLTDWEAGLLDWAADRRQIASPSTFDTADWDVIGGLPDNRAGMAAFVQNLDSGDCAADDETGVLMLDSPAISLPADIVTPRISVNHWYWIESGWDGGNFKISVNGGPFTLIPANAIEITTYDEALLPAFDEFGLILNTNPMAGEDAFTGASGADGNGAWVTSRISLAGLAAPGDIIVLRLDFGIDCNMGEVGWYVDDVEVYACTDESPLAGCGNRILDAGETCDDGNGLSGDGCSNLCQVEDGWSCSDPVYTEIADPGFEAGTPSTAWNEASNNPIGTPICQVSVCGLGGGSGPSEGDFWAWFGGTVTQQEGTLSQSIAIPDGLSELTFDLEIPACDSASDYLEVTVDGQSVFRVDGAADDCGLLGYINRSVDISAFADNASHQLSFHSETFANNASYSNFFVDNVAIKPVGSQCLQEDQTLLTLVKQLVNDNGGTASAADWTLTASGPTSFSGPGPRTSSPSGFVAGTYNLSESGPPGYSADGWSCDGGIQTDDNTVTLADGENVTCTIRNDDLPPSLTLTSSVINDDGGTAEAGDWTLQANGPTPLSGPGPSVVSGASFRAGTYDLSTDGEVAGYTAGDWSCDDGEQIDSSTIRLGTGEAAVCSIVFDDYVLDSSINATHSGGWFNPDTSGQGIFIDIEPENSYMFMAWYTYTEESTEHPYQQRWLTAQGNYNGDRATLTLHETLGGRFDDTQVVETNPVGEVTLVFRGCSELTMEYDITGEGLNGEQQLTRLIPGSEDDCLSLGASQPESVDINAGMDGNWFEPATAGQGFMIDVRPDPDRGDFIFVSWFTYGDMTASGQRWFTAQGAFDGASADIELSETTGGSFDDPLKPTTVPIGTLDIEFIDCGNATLNYSIPGEQLSGDIELIRLLPGSDARCKQLDNPQ